MVESLMPPQHLLLLGMQSPALFLCSLGKSRVCSLCGHLISSLHCHLPSTPACLCSEAKPFAHLGYWVLGSRFPHCRSSLSPKLSQLKYVTGQTCTDALSLGHRQEDLEPCVPSLHSTLKEITAEACWDSSHDWTVGMSG